MNYEDAIRCIAEGIIEAFDGRKIDDLSMFEEQTGIVEEVFDAIQLLQGEES